MTKLKPALVPWFYIAGAIATGAAISLYATSTLLIVLSLLLIGVAILIKNPDVALFSLFLFLGWLSANPIAHSQKLLKHASGSKIHGTFKIYNEAFLYMDGTRLSFKTSLPGYKQGSLLEITGKYIGEYNMILPERVQFLEESENIFDKIHYKINFDLFQAFGIYEEGILIRALITGDRKDMSKEVNENFRKAGVAHVLAISGLHVSFLFSFLSCFSMFLFRNRFISDFLALLLITFYAISLGPLAPCLRALMFTLLNTISRWAGRKVLSLNVWGAAFALSILLKPEWLQDPSFLFSYFSIFGYIYVGDILEIKISKATLMGKGLNYLISVVVPFIFTFPFQAMFFKKVSLLPVVSNAIFVPLVSLTIFEAMLTIVLLEVRLPIWKAFSNCALFIASGTLRLAEVFSNFPGNSIEVPSDWYVLVIFIFAIILMPLIVKYKKQRKQERIG